MQCCYFSMGPFVVNLSRVSNVPQRKFIIISIHSHGPQCNLPLPGPSLPVPGSPPRTQLHDRLPLYTRAPLYTPPVCFLLPPLHLPCSLYTPTIVAIILEEGGNRLNFYWLAQSPDILPTFLLIVFHLESRLCISAQHERTILPVKRFYPERTV